MIYTRCLGLKSQGVATLNLFLKYPLNSIKTTPKYLMKVITRTHMIRMGMSSHHIE